VLVAEAKAAMLVRATVNRAFAVLGRVQLGVLRLAHHFEIRRIVVLFVAVAMMNDLVGSKRPSEHLLGDDAMLMSQTTLHVAFALASRSIIATL
jgi:hypothetical protein